MGIDGDSGNSKVAELQAAAVADRQARDTSIRVMAIRALIDKVKQDATRTEGKSNLSDDDCIQRIVAQYSHQQIEGAISLLEARYRQGLHQSHRHDQGNALARNAGIFGLHKTMITQNHTVVGHNSNPSVMMPPARPKIK